MAEAISGALDHLSGRDFQRLARFIHEYSGIKMPPTKKTMVEGRLRKRVAATGCADFRDYCRKLFDGDGLQREAIHLIDVVTTNKTEFFREPEHFRILADASIPTLLAERRAGRQGTIKVWSTASSIGAEPYTLAMTLDELSPRLGGFRFSIIATDISSRALAAAAAGIYPDSMIAPVPIELRRRYLLRAKNRSRGVFRVAPELRRLVQFGRLNLMQAPYPVDTDMDVIFCRNILIYFDKPTQQAVLERLCDHLRPGGYLFLGHSESLAGMGLPLVAAGNTVFRRAEDAP